MIIINLAMRYLKFLLLSFLITIVGCSQSSQELVDSGKRMKEEGNLRGAIVVFKNALEKNPNDIDARFLLADSYLEADRYDFAEREFLKVEIQDPSRYEVRLKLADLYNRMNRPQEAAAQIQKFLAVKEQTPEAYDLLGRSHLLTRNLSEAESAFRAALALDPSLATARLNLAECLLRSERDEEARHHLEHILSEDGNHLEACRMMARLETIGGNTDAALVWYGRIMALAPGDTEAAYRAGLMHLDKKETDESQRIAEAMLAEGTDPALGFQLLGLTQFTRGDFFNAVTSLQKSLEGRIDLTAYYFLGMSYLRLNKEELALSQFQRFLDFRPTAPEPRIMIAVILLRQNRVNDAVRELERVVAGDEDNATALGVLGNALLAKGDLDGAKSAFERAGRLAAEKGGRGEKDGFAEEAERKLPTADESGLVDSRLLSSIRLIQEEKFAEAIRSLESLLNASEGDALVYNYLALAQFGDKKTDKGVESLLKAKEIRPDYLLSYFNLAGHYLAQGNLVRAAREYDLILERQPQDVRALLMRGRVAERSGREEEAREFFRRASRTGEVVGTLEYAEFLARTGNVREAIRSYESIAGQSEGPQVLFALGALHHRLGETDIAFDYYRRTLQASADHVPALNNLAYLHGQQAGGIPQALELARKAHRLAPENPWVLDTLGSLLMKGGKADEALPLLEKARRGLPENPTVHYHLALAYRSLGQNGEATAALRTSLAFGTFPEVEDARILLSSLESEGGGDR